MLKDLAGNALAAANVASFTVLSGMSPDTNPYTASTFAPGTYDCSAATACNATLDTVAPTFVSMFPKDGATDVSATTGNAVVMYFSEPVMFNTTGVISILNSSSLPIGVVNLTTDDIAISPAMNATKIPIPAVLVKGQQFSLSIKTGIIKDLAGHSLAAITKSFTCLAEAADTSAPTATGMSVNPVSNVIDVFFSEDVMMGPVGTATVSAVGSGVNIATPVSHSNVTISGFKLSLSVYAGSLSSAGTYDLRIAAGSLKDASENAFLGLNMSSMTYVTSTADTTAPTLQSQEPAHEASPSFALPITTSMKLTFSEAVQAAAGVPAATLTPVYGYRTVTITTDNVYIDQGTVMLTGSTLMPGEIYSVAVHSGAFMDLSGNYFAGLAAGYHISTAALMGFDHVSTGNWNAAGYHDGKRYGSCGFADASNVLYIMGGVNGSAGSTGTMMNDVYSYNSRRESSCADSVVPYTCPETACVDAGTLATASVAKTVWRAPTANGAPCTSSTGADFRDLWATVEMSSESCTCPLCLTPPAGTLPTHMANESYVSAYTLLSAAMGTAPLECAPGKLPNGSFTCVVDTQYIGKFHTPYPNCYPAPCTAPPVTTGISKLTGHDVAGSTGGMNCTTLNATNSMVSGGVCAITCDAGFTMAKGFECFEGTFIDAICIPMTPCSQGDVTVANGAVSCSGGTTADYEQTCPITCKQADGFSPYVTGAVATCDVSGGGVMAFAAPTGMTLDEMCVPTTCTPPTKPANAAGFSKSGTSVNAVWTLECEAPYVPDIEVGVSTSCQLSGELTIPSLACREGATCDGSAYDFAQVDLAAGVGDCVADMKSGSTCKIACSDGYEPAGELTCDDGTFTGIIMCVEPGTATETVEIMSSAFALAVSLPPGMDSDGIQSLFTGVVAKTLGIDTTDVAKVDVSGTRRRLEGDRRLQAQGYEVAYQAVIPAGTDPAEIAAKASGIGSGGDSDSLLMAAFAEAGAEVDASSLKVTKAPKTMTATIVRSADGGIKTPSPPVIPTPPPPEPEPTPAPTPATTPAPTPADGTGDSDEEEEGGNTGAIIGGVVGGVVALLIIGGVGFFLYSKSKKGAE
jgi:hypothetical protein